MEKSVSYSTLASPCESGNRQRENINLGKTSKSSWGFGSLGSSALCYKGTPGAPSGGQGCPGLWSYLPTKTGYAHLCKSSFHQQST